ncbi:MAG: glucose-1-phosphate adenylyltransferase [Pseudonocardiales bacterium]
MPTDVLAIVLAGGEGNRLMPLTEDRAKPAVPFGGLYRLIDFPLSNLANAGILRMVVLTQYKSHSLDRHITMTWRMSTLLGNYVTPVPAQQRVGKRWFEGSADAIFQSLNLLYDERPTYVVVFGADNVYRMNPRQMLERHIQSGAALTVAAIRQPLSMADQFGVIEADPTGRITRWREKPKDAVGLPDAPDQVFASMGNYIFTADALIEGLLRDSADVDSRHDMGGDIVPAFVERHEAAVYDFRDNDIPGSTPRDAGYWRDVGTIDSYYDAHQDLISVHPQFNLYNDQWPILSGHAPLPPAKFVFNDAGRRGVAVDSLVCNGVVVSGGHVESSILSPKVFVHSYAEVHGSVLMDHVDVGRRAVIRNAIIDKNVRIPANCQIGVDLDRDRERGLTVSEKGVVVIGKGKIIE